MFPINFILFVFEFHFLSRQESETSLLIIISHKNYLKENRNEMKYNEIIFEEDITQREARGITAAFERMKKKKKKWKKGAKRTG